MVAMQEPVSPLKVVYVLGPGRSGSGILGRLLSTIDGAVFAGELRRVWSRGLRPGRTCACGEPHASCPVWSKLLVEGAPYLQPDLDGIREAQRRAAPEHLGWRVARRWLRHRSPPDPNTPAGRYLEAYTGLHSAFAEVTDARILIDSSKSAADAALLAFRPERATYVVQLVRDPRGVAFSLQNHAEVATGLGRRLVALRASMRWVAKHLTNEAIRRRYGPARSIMLRYEQIVANPRATVDAVAKMLGEASPALELEPGVPFSVPEVHGPDGSKRRRFVSTEVILEMDTRWQRELTSVDRLLVTLVTLPLLHRYGYPIRTRRANRLSRRPEAAPNL